MDPRYHQAENSVMLQPQPQPPIYQDNPAGSYPLSYPNQAVPQGPFAPGTYPGQAVVTVQPGVMVTTAPIPDYRRYSIFTTMCCCFPLGIAALAFSRSTQKAKLSGQWDLAKKKSRTALILNHFSVGLGLVFIVLFIMLKVLQILPDEYISELFS